MKGRVKSQDNEGIRLFFLGGDKDTGDHTLQDPVDGKQMTQDLKFDESVVLSRAFDVWRPRRRRRRRRRKMNRRKWK